MVRFILTVTVPDWWNWYGYVFYVLCCYLQPCWLSFDARSEGVLLQKCPIRTGRCFWPIPSVLDS